MNMYQNIYFQLKKPKEQQHEGKKQKKLKKQREYLWKI